MTTHRSLITATLLAASALTLSSPPALARIVCNEYGECWRVHGRYAYRPDWGLPTRPYNWRWREEEPYGWREQEDRGYWRPPPLRFTPFGQDKSLNDSVSDRRTP